MFSYQIKKTTRRKTLAIKVHNGTVTVYAPARLATEYIEAWLLDKNNWVQQQLHTQQIRIDTKQYPFKHNRVRLFAQNCEILTARAVRSSISATADHENITILIANKVRNVELKAKQLLCQLLSEILEAYIDMQLNYYCHLMALALPNKVQIKVYKTRWGSCNNKRELSFNLLLVGAPQRIIDYVIVHELAHLLHLNHSQAFWDVVEQFYPDYKNAKQWLSKHGESLQWVF